MNKDYYKTLGVKRDASQDEIKKAYRKLSKQHHPDLNKGDKDSEAKFKEINEAYQTLGNEKARSAYDQFGTSGGGGGFAGENSGGFNGQGFNFNGSNFDFGGGDFSDIFEQFFGGGGRTRSRKPTRGADIEVALHISFEEAVFGVEKEIKINHAVECEHCHGSGAESNTEMKTCPECGGAGQINEQRRTILGVVQTRRTCSNCEGTGKIPEKKCTKCHGAGIKNHTENINIKIPSATEDGMVLRVRGKGDSVKGGVPAGDLYLHISVQPSREFTREGFNIYTEIKIHVLQAILGDEIAVKTINGNKKIKIPNGTQPDQKFRLRGEGVPDPKGGAGDHYVTVHLEIPKKLTHKEKELYSELVKNTKFKPDSSSLWEKIFG